MRNQVKTLQEIALKKTIKLLYKACRADGETNTKNVETILTHLFKHCYQRTIKTILNTTFGRKTILGHACKKGHTDIVKRLLDALPEDDRLDTINCTDKNGDTALMLASEYSHTEIVELLLKALPEADRSKIINHANQSGNTALMIASSCCSTETAQLLNALPGQTCTIDHIEIVKRLLDALPKNDRLDTINHTNQNGDTALMLASKIGHPEIVKQLLYALPENNRLDTINHTNQNGDTALILASKIGHAEIMKRVLDALPKNDRLAVLSHENTNGFTALMIALFYDRTEIVEILLNALPKADKLRIISHAVQGDTILRGKTALIAAATSPHENTKTVQLLVNALQDANADVPAVINHQDGNGTTALMIASSNGKTETVKLLLKILQDANADMPLAINHTSNQGRTALILASGEVYSEIVQLLLHALQDASADIPTALNHADNDGLTALRRATEFSFRNSAYNYRPSRHNHIETVRVLLAHGANLTHADTRRVASLIAPNYNPTFPKDKLLAILQNDNISWVNADYTDFSNKSRNEQDSLATLASWGVIVGNQSFVTDMISLRQNTLSLAEHTEYLRLALQAQRFEVAETLLKHLHGKYGQDNKQTVCNYLLHLMVTEHGPLPAVELLLQHGALYKPYTQAHCEEHDKSILEKHTLFQARSPLNDIVKTDVNLRLRLRKNNQTLFHVASTRGNHAVLKKIIEYSRPPTCSTSPST